MISKKIASIPDNRNNVLTEESIVLNHLLNGLTINPDQAYSELGIKHLHSVIPKIERYIKVNRTDIYRPHPRTKKIRLITSYWIDGQLIGIYVSPESREELKKQQTSVNIAKSRVNDNKALIRLCSYCKRETIEAKLHEIYGQQAANDSN